MESAKSKKRQTLKPCPFCGGEAIKVAHAERGQQIVCSECQVRTIIHLPYKEAVKAWNQRVEKKRWIPAPTPTQHLDCYHDIGAMCNCDME